MNRHLDFQKILSIVDQLCTPQTGATLADIKALITKSAALAVALVTRIAGLNAGERDLDPLVEKGIEMYQQAEK